MSVTVNAPFDLRAILATMKSAKEKGVNMNIWDRESRHEPRCPDRSCD